MFYFKKKLQIESMRSLDYYSLNDSIMVELFNK